MAATKRELQRRAVLRWYKQLRDTNNASFLPLFFDRHRYLVLKGGGGSGKSIFAGRKVLERCATEPGHRFLVCRKVAKTLRHSVFDQLKGQALEYYGDQIERIPKGEASDMYIRFKNGSEILFTGLDDVEKLKSIYDITGIWIEEASELKEGDFNQLDIRLRTKTRWYLQIIISFNPISINHWLKKRFFDKKDPRATVHESTYKQNRFLRPEAVETLEAFKESDEYYYMVYCLGVWGVTGRSVFNSKAIAQRLQEDRTPKRVGYFTYQDDGVKLTDVQWVDDPKGYIRLYKEPEPGVPYVIGGDTAGEGSDYFVGQVLDNRTGEQVGTLRERMAEDLYARQLYCLGYHYNTALIGVEANYSTYPIMELQRLRYPRQYVRETMDDYTHKVRQSFGFVTSSKTRPVIIANLIKVSREDMDLIWDEDTLQEMLTFIRNEDFRAEAEEGAHDDTVMALAIAHQIRSQQSYLQAAAEDQTTSWTEDMWEDFRAADPATKAMLIKQWGSPRR